MKKKKDTHFCNLAETKVGDHWLYVCANAGCPTRLRYAKRKPQLQIPCHGAAPVHWLACPYRSNPIGTLPGGIAGVGCSSGSVEVYRCECFEEPVLKKASRRNLARIQERVPGYTGRTCADCRELQETDKYLQALAREVLGSGARIDWDCARQNVYQIYSGKDLLASGNRLDDLLETAVEVLRQRAARLAKRRLVVPAKKARF